MSKAKTCIQCLKEYTPPNAAHTEAWAKRSFCGQRCGLIYRRMSRNKVPLSEAQLAACAKQNIEPRYEQSTMCFKKDL